MNPPYNKLIIKNIMYAKRLEGEYLAINENELKMSW